MLGSMSAVRNTVGAAPPSMHADRDPVAAHRGAVNRGVGAVRVAASASSAALDAMGADRRQAARRRATACERGRIEPPNQRLANAARRSLSGDHDVACRASGTLWRDGRTVDASSHGTSPERDNETAHQRSVRADHANVRGDRAVVARAITP